MRGLHLPFAGSGTIAQHLYWFDGAGRHQNIIHTNDIHGRSGHQEDSVVGFERLTALIEQEKPALVLDVGDAFHGQAFATLEQGAGMAELMKAVKYDAMTPGNHDWHYGKERLKELEQLSGIPLLAANVTKGDSAFFANDGTLVKTVNGVKIGLLGVFDPELQTSTAPRNVQGVTFGDDAQKATELAEKLREQGCDIVIALSHQLYCEEFVSRIRGIDLLIAGHEHAIIEESYPDADSKHVPVVETGAYFENVGLVTITYDPAAKEIQSIKGTLTNPAAYLEETGADIAFENAGGIRIDRLLPVREILR